jgi:hypothetical protein
MAERTDSEVDQIRNALNDKVLPALREDAARKRQSQLNQGGTSRPPGRFERLTRFVGEIKEVIKS